MLEYVIVPSGSDLDQQLRVTPSWFSWLEDDEAYSLYAVVDTPVISEAIQGNTDMADRNWLAAKEHFDAALEKNEIRSTCPNGPGGDCTTRGPI